jgi:serine/threonine-protein kinase
MAESVTRPESLGQYKILDRIGERSLGEVYRARDTRAGRTVALTVVRGDISAVRDTRERFLEDARRASAISHPGIAALYEVGEQDDRVWVACEFVQGDSLHALVGGRPLNPRRAVDIAGQVADALAEAHARDIPHGAVAGDTVVVTPKGRAKLLDLGLASWASRDGLLQSERPTQDRDIAGLGILLFEMLTGAVPQPGARVSRVILGAIPLELDPIVAKALGENGSYSSAAALAGDLRTVGALLEVRKEATDSTAGSPVPVGRRSSRLWPIGVALVLLLAAAALIWWSVRSG